MGYKAGASTGILGQRLVAGFDLADLFINNVGERIQIWDREVTYKGTETLENVLTSDKYLRFNLLANILLRDEKVPLKTKVGLYASGNVRELRVDKKAYRCHGSKYYGTNKKPILDKVDEDI